LDIVQAAGGLLAIAGDEGNGGTAIEQVDRGNVFNPLLLERGISSLLGVPLVAGGDVLGVLHVGTLSKRRFGEQDAERLQMVADRVAMATQSRMSQSERAAAAAMRRSLLPAQLPEVTGFAFASRYVAGDDGEVGGDWYDVFTLPSGAVCVVVGDVVGHGLAAAQSMSQVRAVLRAATLRTEDPAEVLAAVDAHVRHFQPQTMATVLCGIIDPATDVLLMSSAGHPPPVLAFPGDETALLKVDADLPLGVEFGHDRHDVEVPLPPGAVLCLYSDGLVERRRESLTEGLRRLSESAVAIGDGPGWSDELVRRMTVGAGDDDVALLAVAFAPMFRATLPASPEKLAGLRRELRGWLATVGTDDDTAADVLLACGEAAANAVEHAFPDEPGELTVELRLSADRGLTLRVADTGRWRRVPAPGDRGRGLPLMHAVMDSVRVEPGEGGTVVTMQRRLARV